MMHFFKKPESGFALLMTLLVVSVIISVGLTILDVTIKQVRLSSNAKESEIAFHAASAGLECAQYQRRNQAAVMEAGTTLTADCFGVRVARTNSTVTSISSNSITVTPANASTTSYHYAYQVTWGPNNEKRCSHVDTIIINAPTATGTVNQTDMSAIIPGYPSSGKTCPTGGICTVVAVKGFNRACPDSPSARFPAGTVQREVLLEY